MSKRGRGKTCTYCERRLESVDSARGHNTSWLAATKDHVLPKSKGGDLWPHILRLVWACRLCNNLKGNLLPDEWSKFMRAYPRWWTWDQFKHGGVDNVRLALAELVRRESLGPSTLAARTDMAEVTRDDHEGRLVLGSQQSSVEACGHD